MIVKDVDHYIRVVNKQKTMLIDFPRGRSKLGAEIRNRSKKVFKAV